MLIQLGEIEIWRILESVDPFLKPHEFFPDMEPDGLELLRREAPRQLCRLTGKMLIPIQGFLVRTPSHNILVDACVGNDKTCAIAQWHMRSDGRFLAGLTAAGVSPEDVNVVLCTHLHLDHVGWNTRLRDGRWVPTFPNARYILPAADDVHFSAEAGPVYQESVLPVIAAGQADLVSADHMIGDHVSLVPTPGHTPGHVSVKIEAAKGSVVITGDAIHSPAQCGRPHWSFTNDTDASAARKSRRALLEMVSGSEALVVGSHFPLPSIGSIAPKAKAFSWSDSYTSA